METEATVGEAATPSVEATSDAAYADLMFGGAEESTAPATDTPEVKEADLSPAKEEVAPDAAAEPVEEHVQLSKADYMRLMTMEAQMKMREPDAAAQDDAAPQTTPEAKVDAPPAQPGWTPEVTPLPINLDQNWVDAFGFESAEQGNQYVGALINVPIQKAAEYTQNAIAAAKAEMQQQIHAISNNFGLYAAVGEVLKDRPEYRGEHMIQVEYAAKECLKADPTLTVWDLPDAIGKRLDAAATKAKQIMKSGGKINSVPQGGLKGGSTGGRQAEDTGRKGGAPQDSPETAFAKLLGFTE